MPLQHCFICNIPLYRPEPWQNHCFSEACVRTLSLYTLDDLLERTPGRKADDASSHYIFCVFFSNEDKIKDLLRPQVYALLSNLSEQLPLVLDTAPVRIVRVEERAYAQLKLVYNPTHQLFELHPAGLLKQAFCTITRLPEIFSEDTPSTPCSASDLPLLAKYVRDTAHACAVLAPRVYFRGTQNLRGKIAVSMFQVLTDTPLPDELLQSQLMGLKSRLGTPRTFLVSAGDATGAVVYNEHHERLYVAAVVIRSDNMKPELFYDTEVDTHNYAMLFRKDREGRPEGVLHWEELRPDAPAVVRLIASRQKIRSIDHILNPSSVWDAVNVQVIYDSSANKGLGDAFEVLQTAPASESSRHALSSRR